MDNYFQPFLESFLQFGHNALQLLYFSGIQYFTGDVSGMSFFKFSFGIAICKFSYGQMVGN